LSEVSVMILFCL